MKNKYMNYEFLPFGFRENTGRSRLSAVPDKNMLCNLCQALKVELKAFTCAGNYILLDEINTSRKMSEISKL